MFKGIRTRIFGPDHSADADPHSAVSASGSHALCRWSTLQIDGRRVDVFDPPDDAPLSGCVLFLHGHGRVMLKENSVFSELFERHRLAAVCPDSGRSWWMDRICPEFDPQQTPHQWLLDGIVPLIKNRWGIVPPNVGLLGVSMGGQGALQVAFRHARLFPVVAAISPTVNFHQLYGAGLTLDEMYASAEEARQDTVVLNLHPLAWPRHQFFCCDPADQDWFEGCALLAMKLSSSGILHERDLETSAGGHTWDYFNHMADAAVSHIVAGLTRSD
ncbi:MAG: alpha/beta hydrolase-fold protein [Planctomycetaceae bacterium]